MSGKKKIEEKEKEKEGIVVKFKRKDTCGFKKGHKYCVNIIEPKGNGIYCYSVEGFYDITDSEEIRIKIDCGSEKSLGYWFEEEIGKK